MYKCISNCLSLFANNVAIIPFLRTAHPHGTLNKINQMQIRLDPGLLCSHQCSIISTEQCCLKFDLMSFHIPQHTLLYLSFREPTVKYHIATGAEMTRTSSSMDVWWALRGWRGSLLCPLWSISPMGEQLSLFPIWWLGWGCLRMASLKAPICFPVGNRWQTQGYS